MPELRWGPLRREWVIISPERGKRPSDFRAAPGEGGGGPVASCPFCPGNEHLTPPEIARLEGDGGWSVRVVPNKYPALSPDPGQPAPDGGGIYRRMAGLGAHEVIIDSPDHYRELDQLPLDQVERTVRMYVARLQALGRDGRFRYVQLFKNHGREGGASLSHPHTQIIATPLIPPRVEARLEAAHGFHGREGECLLCAIARDERSRGERVVEESGRFLILSPYDARFPFELLILPLAHRADFRELSGEELSDFARVLKKTLARLRALLGDVPYNFVLHTAPVGGGDWPRLSEWYHWHLEIIPRLTRLAGFEWGSGMYINPVSPERAAEYLRGVDLGG